MTKPNFRRGREGLASAIGEDFFPSAPQGSKPDCALHYAQCLGWKVFPVLADKTPYIKDWPNLATDDPCQIERWWRQWPVAGIGLACGHRSGIYVVDIDKSHDGIASWKALEARYGDVYAMTSRTGGGGLHLFFKMPSFELRNTAKKLGPGIDTRGDGGYVVLPPSAHQSGSEYEWVHWQRPARLPRWIVDELRQPDRREEIGGISSGERNATLASYAGALRNVGADRDTLEAALLAINETVVVPTLPNREVRAIAKSISRYTPGLVREEQRADVEEGESKWVVYNGLQLAELPDQDVTWVLPRIAAAGIVTMLSGEWKTAGKTTLLISGAKEVLTGGTFLGEPVAQSPVVYLYEGPASEFNQNDFAYQLHHPDFWLVPQDENMGKGWIEAVEFATSRCLELGARLLVIDTKTAWLTQDGEEENQSGFARKAMNMFAEARLEGIAVVVAAHPTKVSTSLSKMVAGSGQWAAAAGRQVGLWAHQGVTEPRRQLQSVGRQGFKNNFPREVIEWDQESNSYSIIGLVEEIEEAERLASKAEARQVEVEQLVANLPYEPQSRQDIIALAKDRFNWGRDRTDETLRLAVEGGKVTRDTQARGEAVFARLKNDTQLPSFQECARAAGS
jgi:Bifunctional DNA primase/polymerase, N-terminal/Primase C terminal 1 (PriCT-1)/AAA domain